LQPTGLELPNAGLNADLKPARNATDLPSLPGYEILGELGRGGMGVVYKAKQVHLKRLVALKMILAGAHATPQELARFRTEAEAIARLQHPNIVQIYDVGEHDGRPYFSFEYVDGSSLAQKLNGTPQPPRYAAQLVEILARAMHAAHQRGIIHRDLKPANILLTAEGDPKVTDFGLAKQVEGHAALTQSGVIVGTPSYMAPEQAGDKTQAIGPVTDVYALGAILYELLTGRPPFRAVTPLETVMQVLSEDLVAPTRLQRKIPRDLETICLKCLKKNGKHRYASAEDLAKDLGRFLHGEPIHARRPSVLTQAWYWVRRPERIRDAGIILIFLSLLQLSQGLVAILPIGDWPPYMTIRIWLPEYVVYAGMSALGIWVGYRTLSRKLWALRVGFGLGLLSGGCGIYHHEFISLFSFLFQQLPFLFSLPILVLYGNALFAYRVNRDVICPSPDNRTSLGRAVRTEPSVKEVFHEAGSLDRAGKWEKAAAVLGLILLTLTAAYSIGVRSRIINMPTRSKFSADSNAKPTVKIELHLAETAPAEGLTEVTYPGNFTKVYLHPAIELSNADIQSITVSKHYRDVPLLWAYCTPQGHAKMRELFSRNKRLAVLLDGKFVSVITIASWRSISTGSTDTSRFEFVLGKVSNEEADRIAAGIVGKPTK
jgi:predicted Ser/Thr protein kinase